MVNYTGAYRSFSVQQGLDCITETVRESLTPGDVYQYHALSGGVATEKSYPFRIEDSSPGECIFNYTMDGV